PWTIFGQYLTVRPWTPSFTTDQEFPTSLLVWIKLLWLPEGMYTISLLKFIESIIGPVAKIARNTDNKSIGFEKGETTEGVMAENLDNDTVAQGGITDRSSNKDAIAHGSDKEDQFGPWMLVERKSRRRPLTVTKEIVDSIDARAEGSRFSVLSKNYDEVEGIKCTALNGSSGIKGSDGAILGKVLPARGNYCLTSKSNIKC
ncbi:hypothetical protein Gohar_015619, partial [Gossypium harknessii]|nr:hypothetical protein [Gossypium harknessii]